MLTTRDIAARWGVSRQRVRAKVAALRLRGHNLGQRVYPDGPALYTEAEATIIIRPLRAPAQRSATRTCCPADVPLGAENVTGLRDIEQAHFHLSGLPQTLIWGYLRRPVSLPSPRRPR